MNKAKVPVIARALLSLILGAADREYILGDLAEQFARQADGSGRARAALWYWRQLRESVAPSARRRLGHRRGRRALVPGIGPHGPAPRDARSNSMIDRLTQDIRYALRTLRHEPGWTLAAVCTLALAIGATTAIFSVLHAVLLRPLDFENPRELVALEFHPVNAVAEQSWAALDERTRDHLRRSTTYPDFEAWKRSTSDVFENLAVYDDAWERSANLGDGSERLPVAFVSAGFFRALRTRPAIGRVFRPEEDLPGGPDAVILSYALWQRRFGGAADVLGRTIDVDDAPHAIVGVLPAGFAFRAKGVELWLPMARATQGARGWNYEVVGRLLPELSVGEAGALLRDRSVAVATRDGDEQGYGVSPLPLQEIIVGEARPLLLLLSAIVVAVLLIACINVVNLMLTRATGREREHIVRAALGAGRSRLAQQHLTESSIVGIIGGALGLAVATVLTQVFVRLNPTALPRQQEVGIDGGVLGFAFGLSLVVGLGIGLIPALRAGRANLAGGLGAASRGATGGGASARVRDGLVVAQIALALVLMVAAGLLLRSFAGMLRLETGIDARNVLTFETDLPESRYPEFHDAQLFYDELLDRIGALPGVSSAALAIYLPVDGWLHTWDFDIDGYPRDPDEELTAEAKQVTPGYFSTLGIDLVAGRTFDERDGSDGFPVVINESMARRFWPGADAVGREIRFDDQRATVVGVVRDVRYRGEDRDMPQVYLPYAGGTFRWGMDVLIRVDGRAGALAAPIRGLVASIDPEVTVFDMRTLDDRLNGSLAEPRFRTLLLGSFGLAALGLSVIGVYGVMAYAVAQRSRELGVRKALGASRGHVMLHVVRRGAVMTVVGLVLGTAGAYATLGVLQSYLFHLDARDPLTIVVSIAALATASMLACYLPARRAARVDPLIALRAE